MCGGTYVAVDLDQRTAVVGQLVGEVGDNVIVSVLRSIVEGVLEISFLASSSFFWVGSSVFSPPGPSSPKN